MKHTIALESKSVSYVAACIIAYILWSLWSDRYLVEAIYPFEVSIELSKNQTLEDAPKEINLTLRGLRRSLRSLTRKQKTIYIPGKGLKHGTQSVTLKREHFALPKSVHIVDHAPCMIKLSAVD